jgi:hypothetical protein
MFLVDPKVFRFVVKGVKAIFWGVQREHQRENKQNSDNILYFLRLYTEFFIILYNILKKIAELALSNDHSLVLITMMFSKLPLG